MIQKAVWLLNFTECLFVCSVIGRFCTSTVLVVLNRIWYLYLKCRPISGCRNWTVCVCARAHVHEVLGDGRKNRESLCLFTIWGSRWVSVVGLACTGGTPWAWHWMKDLSVPPGCINRCFSMEPTCSAASYYWKWSTSVDYSFRSQGN